jgi:hypothetical protein
VEEERDKVSLAKNTLYNILISRMHVFGSRRTDIVKKLWNSFELPVKLKAQITRPCCVGTYVVGVVGQCLNFSFFNSQTMHIY